MQMLNQALAMSPLDRERFEREERQRFRDLERLNTRSANAEERMMVANERRARRQARNLLHCS